MPTVPVGSGEVVVIVSAAITLTVAWVVVQRRMHGRVVEPGDSGAAQVHQAQPG